MTVKKEVRKLKNVKTGNVFVYSDLLAQRIGIDMIEVTEPQAVAAVDTQAEDAKTRKDNKAANPKKEEAPAAKEEAPAKKKAK